jgi:hypothetical protein
VRDTSHWTEEKVQLIKEHFIPLAVGARVTSKKDAEGEFLHDQCGLSFVGAAGGMFAVTAGGKQLDKKFGGNCDPRRAYAEWLKLPEQERKPGAVSVGEVGKLEWQENAPPPGGLILKVYHRYLGRTETGELRKIGRGDFLSREQLAATFSEEIKREDVLNYNDRYLGKAYMHEAAQDFMWLTESEWKSLVPAQPKVGSHFAVPAGISKRLFVYQLDPVLTHGESNGWPKGAKDIRASELNLTVEHVSADRIRLRMDGFALLGEAYDPAIKPLPKVVGRRFGLGYEPRILGYLDYDRRQGKFTRFDLVAVGDLYGVQHEGASLYFRPGRQPLGVALELTKGDTPADRYPPRCARQKDYGQYFKIK